MSDVELTIGLCAYREAANLRTLLPQIKRVAQQLSTAFEILIVDTSVALDETEAVCSEHGARYVRRQGGEEYADAVRTLLTKVRGKYLIHMDADGSHRATDMTTLWNARHDYDVVIGSRYVNEARSKNPLHLQLMSRCLNAVMRRSTGFHIRDLSNSFRLYRADLLEDVRLQSRYFEVLQELLLELREHYPDLKVGEVPTTFEERAKGESKRKILRLLAGYTRMHLHSRNGLKGRTSIIRGGANDEPPSP
jgi:dolichol-phosphate mannosyltransferase